MKIIRWCAVGVVALLAAAEMAARTSGAIDFPLYTPGPPYGYIPAPNQNGAFLNKYDYAFNELSMGVGRPFKPTPDKTDTLLIGDSIVLGGNPYRQSEKLGPALERATKQTVWPISAGSWSLCNELTYLEQHPEVERSVDRIVFVLNSADFMGPSDWAFETTHPTKRPLSALVFLALKKLAKTPPGKVLPGDPADQWAKFKARSHAPAVVVLYPHLSEEKDPLAHRRFVDRASKLFGPTVRVIDVAADPRWNAGLYKDGIHPKPEAMAILASIIGT